MKRGVIAVNIEERRLEMQDGMKVVLRPLKSTDEQALGDYFLSLSDKTKGFFSPHPFNRETAEKLCKEIDKTSTLRLIAVSANKIVGYFILFPGMSQSSKERYRNLNENEICSVAPSIADEFQNQGLGTKMMMYTIDIARRLGKKKMILSGGVQVRNQRAIHFYKKFGFKIVREFQTELKNYDMVLDL